MGFTPRGFGWGVGWAGMGPVVLRQCWGSSHGWAPHSSYGHSSIAELQSPSPVGANAWIRSPGRGLSPQLSPEPPHQGLPAMPAPWAALFLTMPLDALAPSAPLNSLAAGERQPGGSEEPNAITAPSRSLLPPPAPFIAEAGGREAELALISAEKSRSGPDLWLAARDSSGTVQLWSI